MVPMFTVFRLVYIESFSKQEAVFQLVTFSCIAMSVMMSQSAANQ